MAIKILKTTFVAHRVFLLARGKGGGLGLQPHTQLGALAPCWPCGRRQGWSSCPCARVTRGRASADGTGGSPGVPAPGVCRGRSVGLGSWPTEGSCLVGPHYHSERRLSGVPSSQVISWANQRIVTTQSESRWAKVYMWSWRWGGIPNQQRERGGGHGAHCSGIVQRCFRGDPEGSSV